MLVENFKTTLSGYVRYRGQGHYVFLLHRITGLGTLLFLAIHILDTAVVYFAPAFYADAIAIYRSTAPTVCVSPTSTWSSPAPGKSTTPTASC